MSLISYKGLAQEKATLCQPSMGLIFDDIDLVQLLDSELMSLKQLLYHHKILLFRGAVITPDFLVQLATLLGKPVDFVDKRQRHENYPCINVISDINKTKHASIDKRVSSYWHADNSFLINPPPITLLYAMTINEPIYRTNFVDMNRLYDLTRDTLPANIKQLKAVHEGYWKHTITQEDVGYDIESIRTRYMAHQRSQAHPLVIKHPFTQCLALYISQYTVTKIIGFREQESQALVNHIWHAIDYYNMPYEHIWQQGDLLIRDNRSVIHKTFMEEGVINNDQPMLYRIGIYDMPFFG